MKRQLSMDGKMKMTTIRTLLFRVRKRGLNFIGHIMRNVGLKELTVTGHIEGNRVLGEADLLPLQRTC